MKKFILKQWYPSLCEDIEEGIEVEYKDGWIYYVNTRGNKTCVEFDEYEFNFTDFWELIEEEKPKPLFTTEDGVDKFYSNQPLWEVNKDFEKMVTTVAWVASKGSKYFSHDGNADEYIWRNKPLFSYEDFMRWGNVPYERVIKQLAKERAKEK